MGPCEAHRPHRPHVPSHTGPLRGSAPLAALCCLGSNIGRLSADKSATCMPGPPGRRRTQGLRRRRRLRRRYAPSAATLHPLRQAAPCRLVASCLIRGITLHPTPVRRRDPPVPGHGGDAALRLSGRTAATAPRAL